jgi:hypothetical protein
MVSSKWQFVSMRPEDIRELRDAQPFNDIGVSRRTEEGIRDEIVSISPIHIVRFLNLQAA